MVYNYSRVTVPLLHVSNFVCLELCTLVVALNCVYVFFCPGVMVHPLGDYACQPSDSSVVAHSLTACYYINGAAYTNGATQTISNSVAKVI